MSEAIIKRIEKAYQSSNQDLYERLEVANRRLRIAERERDEFRETLRRVVMKNEQ